MKNEPDKLIPANIHFRFFISGHCWPDRTSTQMSDLFLQPKDPKWTKETNGGTGHNSGDSHFTK